MENDKNSIVEAFVKTFIQKHKAQRALWELTQPLKRGSFTNKLNHGWENIFKMQHLLQVPREQDDEESIQKLLGFKNTEICYVISMYDDFFEFADVFKDLYWRGFASVIMNVSATKFFLKTEQVQGAPPKFIGKAPSHF
jgi:hypothetical protein